VALTIHGVEPSSVFGLIGEDENSVSFALGWVLERSPHFRRLIVAAAFGRKVDTDGAIVALQKHGEDGGFTDVEIQDGHSFHAILEAKRGWEVPSVKQLTRYSPRLASSAAELKRLITTSAADSRYAQRQLPPDVRGVPIVHFSWRDLQRTAKRAVSIAVGFEEKLWLRQFIEHLQEFIAMERQTSNNVFVVALGKQPMVAGKNHTWIDVVEKDGFYFHPVGNSWPVQPPNYMGFRYYGKLQSVRHVDSFDVVENVADRNPAWLDTTGDHFLYRLGPPMHPMREVKTGKIYMNGRVWCAIDTLLSGAFATISAARDETQRRLRAGL
jgi:hypothetical protein